MQPILTAAALDWELVEGRAEGELMCKWAGEIRGKRRRLGEVDSSVEKAALTEAELYRLREGISAQEGVGGDLIIGRNTWKEYIRGLHAGWLGPLEDPASSRVVPSPEPAMVEDQSSTGVETSSQEPAPPATPSEPEAPPPRQELAEDQYESSTPSQVIPSTLDPALPIPYPHILGFLNTPTRIRRFLTKRRLADDVGRQVAAVCLGQLSDDSTASWNEHQSAEEEARGLLEHEESDWPKKYRQPAPDAEGEVPKDHIWSKAMILDPRLSSRLRFFAPNFPDDPTTGTGSDG